MAAKKAPIRSEGVTTGAPEAKDEAALSQEVPEVSAAPEPEAPKADAAPALKKSTPKVEAASAPAPKKSAPKVETSGHASAKAPHAAVESSAVREEPSDAKSEPEVAAKQEPQAAQATGGVAGWVSRMFPGNEHAVYGGIAGLVMAIMIFVVGFWQMLFVSALIVVGVALGQALDGDPKIIRTVRRLISALQGSDNE